MSFAFSKFFDAPIGDSEKAGFAEFLGLKEQPYTFIETVNGMILRQLSVSGGESRPLLSEKMESEWEAKRLEAPSLCLQHSEDIFNGVPELATGLWETLLSFPLGGAHPLRTRDHTLLRASDPRFYGELVEFALEMDRLENRLNHTELGCLFVKGEQGRQGFLFHFVRRKILASGMLSVQWEGWDRWDSRELTVEDARDIFGTTVTLLEIDCTNASHLTGFSKASALLKEALDTPSAMLHAGYSLSPDTIHFEV